MEVYVKLPRVKHQQQTTLIPFYYIWSLQDLYALRCSQSSPEPLIVTTHDRTQNSRLRHRLLPPSVVIEDFLNRGIKFSSLLFCSTETTRDGLRRWRRFASSLLSHPSILSCLLHCHFQFCYKLVILLLATLSNFCHKNVFRISQGLLRSFLGEKSIRNSEGDTKGATVDRNAGISSVLCLFYTVQFISEDIKMNFFGIFGRDSFYVKMSTYTLVLKEDVAQSIAQGPY